MSNREEAARLMRDEPNLTLEQFVERYQGRGHTGDNLWKEIIEAATRSRDSVNRQFSSKVNVRCILRGGYYEL